MPAEVSCEICHTPIPKGASRCPSCAANVAQAPPVPASKTEILDRSELPIVKATKDTIIDQRYKIIERLGQGGFGDVFRVQHLMLQREFALKTLHPWLAADANMRERFFREARVLLDLTHPNIATLRDVGQWQSSLYMVMDLCPGETLGAILEKRGKLPGRELIEMVLPVLDALQHAHEKGVIHRDLKPGNVMVHEIGERREVRLLDFGIAKLLERADGGEAAGATLTGGVLIGTPQYMSPEQANCEDLDLRSDIYSLGVILYIAATGRPPYFSKRPMELLRRIATDPVPTFQSLKAPDEPKGLEAVIRKCLEKRQESRPSCAAQLAGMLKVLLQTPAPQASAETAGAPEPVAAGEAAVGAGAGAQIIVFCRCGKPVHARSSQAGNAVKCGSCGRSVIVPLAAVMSAAPPAPASAPSPRVEPPPVAAKTPPPAAPVVVQAPPPPPPAPAPPPRAETPPVAAEMVPSAPASPPAPAPAPIPRVEAPPVAPAAVPRVDVPAPAPPEPPKAPPASAEAPRKPSDTAAVFGKAESASRSAGRDTAARMPSPASTPPPVDDGSMITFACTCGRSITVRASHAGKLGQCPKCLRSVTVPVPTKARAAAEDVVILRCPQCARTREIPAWRAGETTRCPNCGTEYAPPARR